MLCKNTITQHVYKSLISWHEGSLFRKAEALFSPEIHQYRNLNFGSWSNGARRSSCKTRNKTAQLVLISPQPPFHVRKKALGNQNRNPFFPDQKSIGVTMETDFISSAGIKM